jgi:hypothetical protein
MRWLKKFFDRFRADVYRTVLISLSVSVLAILVNLISESTGHWFLAWWADNLKDVTPKTWVLIIVTMITLMVALGAWTVGIRLRTERTVDSVAQALLYQDRTYSLLPESKPLKVFISSMKSGSQEERRAVTRILREFPLIKPILAEEIDPSGKPIQDVLDGIMRDADVFIVIIGSRLPHKLEGEYLSDIASKKPVLVFARKGEAGESPEHLAGIRKLLSNRPALWTDYSSTEDLTEKVRLALLTLLVNAFRLSRVQLPTHERHHVKEEGEEH